MFIGSRCRGNKKIRQLNTSTRVCTKELENKKEENGENCQLCDSVLLGDLGNAMHVVGLGGQFEKSPKSLRSAPIQPRTNRPAF